MAQTIATARFTGQDASGAEKNVWRQHPELLATDRESAGASHDRTVSGIVERACAVHA